MFGLHPLAHIQMWGPLRRMWGMHMGLQGAVGVHGLYIALLSC